MYKLFLDFLKLYFFSKEGQWILLPITLSLPWLFYLTLLYFEYNLSDSNKQIIKIISALWSIIIPAIHNVIRSVYEKHNSLNEYESAILLDIINNYIVGEKKSIIEHELENLKHGKDQVEDSETIFKFDMRSKNLVKCIFHFFDAAYKDKGEFKVVFVEMGDKFVKRVLHNQPQSEIIRSNLTDLQQNNCGFTRCKELGKMLIIEDIQNEAKKRSSKKNFVFTHDSSKTEDGSLVLFPVKGSQPNIIPYVISVRCNKKNFFKENNRILYEKWYFILNCFAERISLEYSLHTLNQLKDKHHDKKENNTAV